MVGLRSAACAAWLLAGGAFAPVAPPRRAATDIEIVGFDYAFKVPAELPPGLTTFRFRNAGKHRHEFNIVQLKSGVSLRQFIDAANADKPLSPMIERTVGVLFAEPGDASASALTVNLIAGGTYAVQCIFRDSSKASRHRLLGMFSSIVVMTAGNAVRDPRPAPVVDTIVAMDYAFKFPRTLAPGRHRLVFVNAGKQRHEINISRMKSGATYRQIADLDAKDGDIEPLLDQDLGVLHAPGGTNAAGMLDVDLIAGREYLLECGFSDTDTSPPHYKLGMSGSIKVASPRR